MRRNQETSGIYDENYKKKILNLLKCLIITIFVVFGVLIYLIHIENESNKKRNQNNRNYLNIGVQNSSENDPIHFFSGNPVINRRKTRIFSIFLPNYRNNRMHVFINKMLDKSLNATKEFVYEENARPSDVPPVEKDSDSTDEQIILAQNENQLVDPNSIDLREIDIKDFIKEWANNYNNLEENTEKINQNFTNADFNNIIKKLILEGDKDYQQISNKNINDMKKNDFDVVLDQIIAKNTDFILNIKENLADKRLIGKCVQKYLHGLDFNEEKSFVPRGIVVKNWPRHMLLAAIGKKALEIDILNDLEMELNDFSKNYTDEFEVTNLFPELKVKKKMLSHYPDVISNPCLVKIFEKATYIVLNNQNFHKQNILTYDEAIDQNNNYELAIIFNKITLNSNDIRNLTYRNKYMTLSEVLLSQALKIRGKIQQKDFQKIVDNIENKMCEWGIRIPDFLIDYLDDYFMVDPIKLNNYPNANIVDKAIIEKSFESGNFRHPYTGENLYSINDYPPAEKLKRAWSRFKARLGPKFNIYCEYKEKERVLMQSVELIQYDDYGSFFFSERNIVNGSFRYLWIQL
ncbi:hypothetical protein EDEG_02629 [Edhazardia aedis USNM 41457]|uniref:Uncharacterized protein n=1 Tax=Edhazardia aedis (strain USNM 41457) TaxID=1003232 RepID=J9DK48_EDHAE|nr:hypothetical protein EDEG_02629 [Edhazardia aedis USNM 41457]|eukprot:EJW02985.1 hypothetical protein EDEG_02629 [Edhazardia aedis USNM 41457]